MSTVNTTNAIATATATAVATQKEKTPAQMMQSVLDRPAMKKLFEDTLKDNAGTFCASLIDLYKSDSYLQNCEAGKVAAECLKAVSLNLPINKQLGFAYVIPRRNKGVWEPSFQLGYKGYIQLCMRSGAYKHINAGAVYEGELVKADKLTGEVDLSGEAKSDKVIGYFAFFETVNGFRKCLYWSNEKITAHINRYSDSYKSGSSIWKNNFEEMAIKTVLRYLLSHYGLMSVELTTALTADNDSSVADRAEDVAMGNVSTADNVIVAEETGEVVENA